MDKRLAVRLSDFDVKRGVFFVVGEAKYLGELTKALFAAFEDNPT